MNIEQMEQNAALELFRYLKEHLIPLAKNKNDKIFESDVTIQITRKQQKEVSNKKKKDSKILDTYKTEKAVFERLEAFCAWYRENYSELYVYRNARTKELKDKAKTPVDFIFCKNKQEVNKNGTCIDFNKKDVVAAAELDGMQHGDPNSRFYSDKKSGLSRKELYTLQVNHDLAKQDWMNANGIAFQRFVNYGPNFAKEIAELIIHFVLACFANPVAA